MPGFTIGKLARAADVGVETVRYYQRLGLIAEPPRPPRGYRRYPPEVVERLRFIRRCRAVGLSLDDIGGILILRDDGDAPASEVRARVEARVGALDGEIAQFQAMRDELAALVTSCDGQGGVRDCCILTTLGGSRAGSRG